MDEADELESALVLWLEHHVSARTYANKRLLAHELTELLRDFAGDHPAYFPSINAADPDDT